MSCIVGRCCLLVCVAGLRGGLGCVVCFGDGGVSMGGGLWDVSCVVGSAVRVRECGCGCGNAVVRACGVFGPRLWIMA